MRVLVTTLSFAGHLHPMVPTLRGLQAAGHSVQVACEPRFAAAVADTGLPAVVTGEDVDLRQFWAGVAAVPDPTRQDAALPWREHLQRRAERSSAMFAGLARAAYTPLRDLVTRTAADLVLFDPACFAGPAAARALGVPAVRHLWGYDTPRLRRDDPEPALRRLFEDYDLTGGDHLGALTVELGPASLGPAGLGPAGPGPVPRPGTARAAFVPWHGPAGADGPVTQPRAASGARPRVCLVWSETVTVAGGHVSPLQAAVDALSAMDVELVTLIGDQSRRLLGELPARVEQRHGTPVHLLLPGCDLVVHPGSSQTVMTAAAAGVPQLLLPAIGDQFDNAGYLTRRGVGLALDHGEVDPGELRRTVHRLLAPDAAARADELRRENDALPSPAELVPVLEAVAGAPQLAGGR